jgi:hypothetical protein
MSLFDLTISEITLFALRSCKKSASFFKVFGTLMSLNASKKAPSNGSMFSLSIDITKPFGSEVSTRQARVI